MYHTLKTIDPRLLLLLPLTLMIVGVTSTEIADYDFWWHINLGREIYNTGSITLPDSFSYTFAGTPQFSGEWLADLSFYLAYLGGGFWGVAALKVVVVLAVFYILLLRLLDQQRDGVGGWLLAAVLTMVVVLFAIRFRLFVRPYIFSFLFFSLFLLLLERYTKTNNARMLYALPWLEILWANMSKGLIFGPLLICVYIVGALLQGRLDRRLIVVLSAVLLTSTISPEGVSPYGFLLTMAKDPAGFYVVGEQQPLSFALLWGQGWAYTAGYQLLVLGSLFYFTLLGGWRNYTHLLIFLAFFAASIYMIRLVGFFSLAVATFAIHPASRLIGWLPDWFFRRRELSYGIIGLLLFAVGGLAVFGSSTYKFGIGPNGKNIPDEALAWLETEQIKGRIFNSYPYGGYIAWAKPGEQVYIDGRINQLFPPEFHQHYFRVIEEPAVWKQAEEKWGFTIAVLEYDYLAQGRHFPLHLKDNAEWAPVYWGEHSVIYLKRTEQNISVIKRHQYQLIKPNFSDFSYLNRYSMARGHKQISDRLVAMVDAEVARHPYNQELLLARLYLLYNIDRISSVRGLQELEITLAMEPDLAIEHSAAAHFYLQMGRKDEAQKELMTALEINPSDEMALAIQSRMQ
ncbi:hypothetical protein MNBD_GAMMA26-1811 [hydrothermal vent metagenome]|uniref:Uncharacterized protein n=1 Tax=hydrothermal vent metagenome TaxID=652676 RepID=A0A3B1B9M6_9ZZZZ